MAKPKDGFKLGCRAPGFDMPEGDDTAAHDEAEVLLAKSERLPSSPEGASKFYRCLLDPHYNEETVSEDSENGLNTLCSESFVILDSESQKFLTVVSAASKEKDLERAGSRAIMVVCRKTCGRLGE